MLHRLRLIVPLLLLAAAAARAQYDVSFTHYWMMEPQYNPAAVGIRPNLRVLGAYSNQMTGYTDNPRTMYVGVDMPLYFINMHHAIGGHILNDEIGIFSHKRVTLQYAYRARLLGGTLALGLSGEILNETLDGGKIDAEETGDPALPSSKLTGNRFDAGAGIYFDHRKGYFGASVMHLTAPTVTLGETNKIDIKRAYYLTAGYNIFLVNPLFSIHPTMRWLYDGIASRTDINVRGQLKRDTRLLFAGAGYSPGHSAQLFVGGSFKGVVLSYSYEAYTGGAGVGNGAHELAVSYEMKLNIEKKGKNRHQSVRLL